ncbi:hypothetical protein PC120_g14551 [Phytophthora cactorum]|nr:hypothetical protein PC120_g14551 [Phytophthora cactorum]
MFSNKQISEFFYKPCRDEHDEHLEAGIPCVISAFNLNVVMNVVTHRVSAVIAALVQALSPALRSGLRTPSPFPERPPSGRSAVPLYLGGEEILSNEYEDKPDLGSSSGVHSPRFARLSTESSRAHRAVVAAGAERYPSAGSSSKVQQELRYQKAQVAQAVQTASNFQVELGTQVMRLHDRVAALEKLDYAASSSSVSHQG